MLELNLDDMICSLIISTTIIMFIILLVALFQFFKPTDEAEVDAAIDLN